jgi:putative zinc finger/helix-turn-helix YgiT family protein
MEDHAVQTIAVSEHNVFKNVPVEYNAEYCYCDKADETYADEQQISLNDIAMKDAYREKMGLLTSHQIASIRARYGISQSDLCLLLGWGAKTITRYESHQVQDIAHDTILRKLDSDPEWFLQLLHAEKESLSAASYAKYMETGTLLFEQDHDLYLKSAIMSKYARFLHDPEATGGKALSLDVVVDMIHYYANSSMVTSLYRVKLMKMLWYADSLSYKRYGHAISGMVYRALPMGAVPLAYESIVDLSAIHCEEIEMGEGTAYHFLPTEDKEYPHLTSEDMEVLDAVIQRFGKASKNEIVDTMHQEDAYIETALYDIIQFKYAKALSLS